MTEEPGPGPEGGDGDGEGEEDDHDPFANLQAPDGANPFDEIDTVVPEDGWEAPGEDDPVAPGRGEGPSGDDGDGEPDGREAAGGGATGGPPGAAEDPFGSLDAGTADRDGGDPFEAFDQPDVDDIDPDVVWERLTDHHEAGERGGDEPTVYEVSKHKFCERCEHFSSPPAVGCGHEGTEIVEFLGMERVRLADCPVVAEYRRVGDVSEID